MVEEVIGELQVGEFRHLEQTARYIRDLIMRRIKISQTARRERNAHHMLYIQYIQ